MLHQTSLFKSQYQSCNDIAFVLQIMQRLWERLKKKGIHFPIDCTGNWALLNQYKPNQCWSIEIKGTQPLKLCMCVRCVEYRINSLAIGSNMSSLTEQKMKNKINKVMTKAYPLQLGGALWNICNVYLKPSFVSPRESQSNCMRLRNFHFIFVL